MNINHIRKNNKERHVQREKALLFELKHNHLIKIYKTFKQEENIFFAFEYCARGSLEKMISGVKAAQAKNRAYNGGGLSEPLARIYMAQLVNALEYLQSESVMHRDLKPLNVMIDDNYNIKLIDFGEAKRVDGGDEESSDEDQAALEAFVGTPNYLSPEVIRKDKHSPAIDIWATGCIFFKMLVGAPAFPGTNH